MFQKTAFYQFWREVRRGRVALLQWGTVALVLLLVLWWMSLMPV